MTEFRIRLSDDFLRPYRNAGDPFRSLLARSTYLTKYSRGNESWAETIKRVVEGNINLSSTTTLAEAEQLYDLFYKMDALPPGRGLWTGGVPGIPADARFNCWYATIRRPEDWCWVANSLMLGGGVGVGLGEIDKLPLVQFHDGYGEPRMVIVCRQDHPNIDEVNTPFAPTWEEPVADSRQGWIDALEDVFRCAFSGAYLAINVSDIRPRGAPIKTFGGVACGPGPLVHLLKSVWNIIRGAAGRKLTSVECLDITNHIGLCIKSGNVRRSALICIGDANDQPFRDAKKDWAAVTSHRHTSNNTICLDTEEQIRDFDWHSYVEDVSVYGEPGIFNRWLTWQSDVGALGLNPCGEQALHDFEACNLAEVFPARHPDMEQALKLVVRYCMRQRLTPLSDPTSDEVGRRNMRVGVGIGGLCDFVWTEELLNRWRTSVQSNASQYAAELGVSRPITTTTVKPSGTISLLNESSPGLHAPWAPFYVRRTRIAKNDTLAPVMMEAGVPFEDCIYDKTGNTLVFSFPVARPYAMAYATTDNIRDQFRRQVMVQQNWADNAVSATLTFGQHEKAELEDCLRTYVPKLKSTSVLSTSHGYAQAPYETIDQPQYEQMYAAINHDHPLTRGGEIEIDECAGGTCPVR